MPRRDAFVVRSRRKVHLGPLVVEIRSNEADFGGMHYFLDASDPDTAPAAHYTLDFCNLKIDGPWPLQALRDARDSSYRAKRFAAGYYITDHFGAPAYLVTQGTHYRILCEDFEPILWPYVVKLLLTLYSIEHSLLHLKAASIAIDGTATLIVGRGGSGKTILLTRLCQNGAQFLSNTHSLIANRTVVAVPSAMRVRNDALFGPAIASGRLRAGIKPDEYVVDPLDLGWSRCASAPLVNVCLMDYRGPDRCEIAPMNRDTLLEYMEQFALAVNVYGLKEDLLDQMQGDVAVFGARMSAMKAGLRALVEHCNAYRVSCDLMNDRNLNAVLDLLRSSR